MTQNTLLPQGQAAALLPGASYSLPGLFRFSSLLYQCLDQVEDRLAYRIPVKYLYGAPRVRWNCGRLMIRDDRITGDQMETELQGARDHGITPLLTFSTVEVTEADLKDPKGNQLLEILDRVRGGAIVSHPLLRDYIRRHYPNVEVHASVILTAFAETRDKAYYDGLAAAYDRFVPHPDDNFDLELLARLSREKAEIMVNEPCGYQCHQRKEHYLSISQDQNAILEGRGEVSNFLDRCPYVPNFKQKGMKTRNITLITGEVAAIRALGFDLFKLQGRLDDPYVVFFDFFRYALEPDLAFPAMFPVFSYAIRAFESRRRKQRRLERE